MAWSRPFDAWLEFLQLLIHTHSRSEARLAKLRLRWNYERICVCYWNNWHISDKHFGTGFGPDDSWFRQAINWLTSWHSFLVICGFHLRSHQLWIGCDRWPILRDWSRTDHTSSCNDDDWTSLMRTSGNLLVHNWLRNVCNQWRRAALLRWAFDRSKRIRLWRYLPHNCHRIN